MVLQTHRLGACTAPDIGSYVRCQRDVGSIEAEVHEPRLKQNCGSMQGSSWNRLLHFVSHLEPKSRTLDYASNELNEATFCRMAHVRKRPCIESGCVMGARTFVGLPRCEILGLARGSKAQRLGATVRICTQC